MIGRTKIGKHGRKRSHRLATRQARERMHEARRRLGGDNYELRGFAPFHTQRVK